MAADSNPQDVTTEELTEGLQLPGGNHVLRVDVARFRVRLPVNPADTASWDDSFSLIDDGGARQTRTVANDQVPGDAYLDLVYLIKAGKSYSLEVNLGDPCQAFFLFEDKPYDELVG